MTRALAALILAWGLTLAGTARAQVDFAKIAAGVQGCPELAADAGLGSLAAFFCEPGDRTILDLPISTLSPLIRVRAGSFARLQRYPLLAVSQGTIPDSQFAALRDQLFAGEVLSIPQSAQYRSLLAEAAQAEAAGDDLLAAALRQQAAAILGNSFDASIPDLLLARIDRDRLADLRAGLLTQIGGADTVTSYAGGLAQNLNFAQLAGAPSVTDPDGLSVVDPVLLTKVGIPFFVGPDGLANTVDDLPYVTNNPAASAAGYALAAPIAGTTDDRFDRVQGSGVTAIPVYSRTAQRIVPILANPGFDKLVEVYGVYTPKFLALNGCSRFGLNGTFDRQTGICTDSVGNDVTAEAQARGCGVLRIQGRGQGTPIGENADGDCIELNTSVPAPARLQVEVIPLLGDPALRPVQAALEPADLTDLKLRGMLLPARPVSPTGTVAFPAPANGARRGVDPRTGAPVLAAGPARCEFRLDASSLRVGPNGVPGDGDDVFPSSGSCLLWGAADANGAQHLLPSSAVAASHSANQSLFHTLCTTSFDADSGFCSLDDLNGLDTFDFISATLGGLGGLAGIVLDGTQTIRTAGNPLASISAGDQLTADYRLFQFLAINPKGIQDQTAQDLGLNLQPASAALLGCGEGFASPCSKQQAQVWAADPAITASIGLRVSGGIDLMNTDAGVLIQEFAVEKALRPDMLVGAAPGAAMYLPGVNFSRNGTFVSVAIPGTVGQTVQIETGDFLPLTPAEVLAMTPAERAAYQHGGADQVQADGWVERMPWAVDPNALATFGAIVFQSDPNDPIAGPGNVFNATGGEYCGRWMNRSTAGPADDPANSRTPFNETCTALETASANYERLIIAQSILGPDRVFDPPESLAELVAMLDDDRSNDATGDPISGPDGIFVNNQFVFSDDEMDFQVAPKKNPIVGGEDIVAPADKAQALEQLKNFDPNVSCTTLQLCFYDVTATLHDADDATSNFPLVLTLPIGFTVDWIVPEEPNDPNQPLPPIVIGQTKVNLARLQVVDRHSLLMLFAGQPVSVNGQIVQMNQAQRIQLFGVTQPEVSSSFDINLDNVNELDEDKDGVWDGADDYSPGPVSDDEVLCGTSIRGDVFEDGIQYESYRRNQAPGSAAFRAEFPNGLAPRSAVFCRSLNRLLSLVETAPDGTRRFVWHGTGALPDADGDGLEDPLDNCPTLANAGQQDGDGDGVGDVCDNCVAVANPRVATDYLAQNGWATLTGGQRDDDHDGYGNRCDAKFGPGAIVGTADLAELRASSAKNRSADTCGTSGTRACAVFDLEETGDMIGAGDVVQFRLLNGKVPGPKCPTCPLACAAGDAGGCQ